MHLGTVVEDGPAFQFVILVLSLIDNDGTLKRCTGVAVKEDIVLSCAHCFTNIYGQYVHHRKVILGQQVKLHIFSYFKTKELLFHPGFSGQGSNDIAVVRSRDANFPNFYSKLGGGIHDIKTCEIFLFGMYDNSNKSPIILHKGVVHPIPGSSCGQLSLHFCSFMSGRVVPCNGDSGGPLFCASRLTGILSRLSFQGSEACGDYKKGIVIYESMADHKEWLAKSKIDIMADLYNLASTTVGHPLIIYLCTLQIIFTINILKYFSLFP